ncbi:MAG: SanA/YdcF family protein [Myxococcota bacterium]
MKWFGGAPLPRRLLRALLGVALVSFLLANLWVVTSGRRLVTRAQDAIPADVIVVLGCAVYGDVPSAVLRRRLDVAADLYARGLAPRILVSGRQSSPAYDEPGVMRQTLLQAGVSADDILTDPTGHRTFASIQAVQRLFQRQRVIIVTSDFHLPRSVFLAEKFELDVQGVAASDEGFSLRARLRWALREFVARGRAVWDLLWSR